MKPLLMIFVIGLIPLLESRYAIVYAYVRGIPFWEAYMVLSLVVVLESVLLPLLLPYLDYVVVWLDKKRVPLMGRLRNFLFNRARKKGGKLKYSKKVYFELFLFVAIPLPGTGIYTGSLVAYIFGFDKKRTILTLFFGGLLAMTVNALVTYGIIDSIMTFSS